MAKKSGCCVVCGSSPTVKSHLFPRALMLDIRGDARTLYEVSRRKPGHVERQNGIWDDRFLCKVHEDLAGAGDDYAIEFCRRMRTDMRPHQSGRALVIDKPRPDLLVKFVYGVIWRHVMAPINGHLRQALGPYKDMIEAALFADGALDLPVILGRSNLTIEGRMVETALSPYRQRLSNWNTWHFVLGLLEIHLKTDQRPLPEGWHDYIANGINPVVVHKIEPMEMASVPLLRPLTDRIREAGRRGLRSPSVNRP